MVCRVKIDSMEFRSSHGCYDLERRVGGNFTVDVSYDIEVGQAVSTDSVSDTVSYVDVYETVREQMKQPSNIIEHVASRIIDALYVRFAQVSRVEVTVSKIAPPLGGKAARVSVTLAR